MISKRFNIMLFVMCFSHLCLAMIEKDIFEYRFISLIKEVIKHTTDNCETYYAELSNGDELEAIYFRAGPMVGQTVCCKNDNNNLSLPVAAGYFWKLKLLYAKNSEQK